MYNEPDGIENATHNTFAKLTWTLSTSIFRNNMYCGLHFHFRRGHYHS
jgi:hypothetical protein